MTYVLWSQDSSGGGGPRMSGRQTIVAMSKFELPDTQNSNIRDHFVEGPDNTIRDRKRSDSGSFRDKQTSFTAPSDS